MGSRRVNVRTDIVFFVFILPFCSISHVFSFLTVVLNGIQDTGIENGEVYFSGFIDTESSLFEINEVMVDLCNHAVEENLYGDGGNGDDAYQNGDDANNGDDAYYDYDGGDDNVYNDDDANNGDDNNDDDNNNNNQSGKDCELEDGTYNFSTELRIPQMNANWGDTGWKATGQLTMYTYKGEQLGSCTASFRTLSEVGPSSKTVFLVMMPLAGVVLFILTYLALRYFIRIINRDLRDEEGNYKCAPLCHEFT
jgi:hypothetical protein